LWLAVNAQLKLFTLQAIDEMALFVKDHEIRLGQVSVNANYVFHLVWFGAGDFASIIA